MAAHEPFVRAATGPIVILMRDAADESDPDRWTGTLAAAGAVGSRIVAVSADRPPTPSDVDGAGGVYVPGGLTPAYRDVLVGAGTSWLAAAGGVPYAGFSAGASIAARQALVGGWRITRRGRPIEVCARECGEDLDEVTVLPGLGLVDFMVEVHAAQWGTLRRLVHALPDGGDGWAIDENTALEVAGTTATVHGGGCATWVRRVDGRVRMRAYVAGDTVELR